MSFTDYQNQASSEKLVLATLDASKRLMGWTLDTGSVYKIPFTFSVITSVEDSGTAYTEVASTADLVASSYYLDRVNQLLYVKTTGSDNPNGRFMVATFKNFFANAPIVLPHDLADGFEVFWEPMIDKTSQFGVEIDTINQASEAIEGSGSLTIYNDHDFWTSNFDKLTFENKSCRIYSYNRDLDVTEAKLIFTGYVEKKSYTTKSIVFSLRDLLSNLRSPVALTTVSDLGLRNSSDYDEAFQRTIIGRVFGHKCVNLDAVLDGYPITGTISISSNSATVTGSGTAFLAELSKDDQLVLGGENYTIATVTSNTAATLSANYTGTTSISAYHATVLPAEPKRWMNRTWLVSGHALREPVMNVLDGSDVTTLHVDSVEDVFPGDTLYVGTLGSGEIATVLSILNSHYIKLATSLALAPVQGSTVTRPAIQNVRIDDVPLIYYRDYTFNATTGILTLRTTAEANAGPIRQMTNSITLTNTSRTISGTGLDSILKPGYQVCPAGTATYYEVLYVTSPTAALLRTAASATTTATGLYKGFILSNDSVVSCDVLGRTEDGTTLGRMIRTGASAVRVLLGDLGLGDLVVTDEFTLSDLYAPQDIGLVIPQTDSETTAPTYRDVINKISRSIQGALVQTDDFRLTYTILQPSKSSASLRLRESDIESFSSQSTVETVVKTAIVLYRPKEYDYLTSKASVSTSQNFSESSTYLLKTERSRTFDTCLVTEVSAARLSARWSLILEQSAGLLSIKTKLQAALLEVGDIIDVEHRKLFVRFGGTDQRRLCLVQKVQKDGFGVSIEAVDLSNMFNRVCNITESSNEYVDATDEEKLYGGYITDVYGMIDNDPETFALNIIY